MLEINNSILIAGSGQNVGKTTLACQIIEKLSGENEVTAIKISGHQHKLTTKQKIIFQKNGLTIFEELNKQSNKDSSLFLQYGAKKSYFIQTDEKSFEELAIWIKENITGWIVCESGSLGREVIPSRAFHLENSVGKKPDWNFPYQTVIFDGKNFNPGLNELLNGLI